MVYIKLYPERLYDKTVYRAAICKAYIKLYKERLLCKVKLKNKMRVPKGGNTQIYIYTYVHVKADLAELIPRTYPVCSRPSCSRMAATLNSRRDGTLFSGIWSMAAPETAQYRNWPS